MRSTHSLDRETRSPHRSTSRSRRLPRGRCVSDSRKTSTGPGYRHGSRFTRPPRWRWPTDGRRRSTCCTWTAINHAVARVIRFWLGRVFCERMACWRLTIPPTARIRQIMTGLCKSSGNWWLRRRIARSKGSRRSPLRRNLADDSRHLRQRQPWMN